MTAELVAQSNTLHKAVQNFIGESAAGRSPQSMNALALAILAFQRAHCPAIAQRLGDWRPPAGEHAWRSIPGMVTDAFAHRRIAVHPPALDARVFRTSGTTSAMAGRGEHPLRLTETYEVAAVVWARKQVFDALRPAKIVALLPSPEEAPHSSLSFMVGVLGKHLGIPVSYFAPGDSLDTEGVTQALRAPEPLCVFGTSFALAAWMESIEQAVGVHPGSFCIYTGGFKGRSRELSKEEQRKQLGAALSLPSTRILSEYGMTELSSQLYECTHSGDAAEGFAAPPWLGVVAVDPLTLEPVRDGVEGIAKFVDLANIDSVVAVQTYDRIVIDQGRVHLRGRLPNAEARGCSLAVEHLLRPPT